MKKGCFIAHKITDWKRGWTRKNLQKNESTWMPKKLSSKHWKLKKNLKIERKQSYFGTKKDFKNRLIIKNRNRTNGGRRVDDFGGRSGSSCCEMDSADESYQPRGALTFKVNLKSNFCLNFFTLRVTLEWRHILNLGLISQWKTIKNNKTLKIQLGLYDQHIITWMKRA